MKVITYLASEIVTDLHQPNGLALQIHEMPDGSGVLTFSDEFIAAADWRVGDEIQMCPEEALTQLFLHNATYEFRKNVAAEEDSLTEGG